MPRALKMMEKDPKQFLIQGDVYEVEKLVGIKIVKGKKLYRVRWRGYGKESDTLEPEENLLSCKDMILELEEKMKDKRKCKKEFKGQTLISQSSVIYENMDYRSERHAEIEDISKYSDVTWQATEVHQGPGPNLKDTFWRDFDEGKINIPDKDMYSKVKERASRTFSINDNSKSSESVQKENPLPPLCPKVVLKRKPISRSNESLAYRSSLKKPISLHVKKRKKYDILRDYRRRKSRIHRKRNINENHQINSSYRIAEKSENFNPENGMNILQELLINDEVQGSVHTNLNGTKINSENVTSTVPKNKDSQKKSKDYYYEDKMDVKKNHPLMCRITLQEKSKTSYSSFKQSAKNIASSSVHNGSISSLLDFSTKKAFFALLDAAVNDRLEKVEKLCTNQYVINCVQDDGTTALMVAAKLGLFNVAKILLNANAHKDKQNRRGETALMLACRNKHPRVAKLLLEHGANFAITNAEGVNVLRITNQYASKTILHSILVEHIMRIVSEFEGQARSVIEHIAEIKYALFPIQCFSLNEGPKYSINFHHHVKLESPGKSGKQNLLFIANSTIKSSSIQCVFDADSPVHNVFINGIKQELFRKGEYSVFKMTGLQNGNNKVSITTQHYPESEVKLVVCAYRVHRSIAWFPAQKLKNEFVD